jgi:cytochrome c oxidase assembly factor CtaG
MLVSSLVVVLTIYAMGLARVWRSIGYGRGVRFIDAAAFGFGWLALAAALSAPLHEWSEHWLAAHMVQHELLMVVAAPLIACSTPLTAFLWAIPAGLRKRVVEAVHRPPLTTAWGALTAPAFGFVLYGVALWIWHVPALYDYAVKHEGVHAVQHLSFFGTATLFWWGITHGGSGRLIYGAAVVYLFATAVHGGVLGALLTVSPRVLYVPYLSEHPSGLTPLEDQQLAGLLMWIPAGVSFVVGALFLFAAWLRQSDRLSRFKAGPALRPGQIR